MSYEIAAIILLLGSSAVILTIVFRKIPILVQLSEVSEGRIKEGFFSKISSKVKDHYPSKPFSFDIFLQKVLSKIRILTLKVESKTSGWLQKLREKAQRKNMENGNYWQDLKDSAKKRKK